MTPPLRLGTRSSALARWQADWVAARLKQHGVEVELVLITTQGDAEQRDPIGNLGSPGVFTKEIQRALLEDRVDLAVHSLKDLPTEPIEGLCLAAVPPRETTADVLISREGHHFADLPAGATIGTGSLRRRAQLLHLRPDLAMAGIRGNVDTRLEKLSRGDFDAIVLAEAGLKRLGLSSRITEILPGDKVLPAVGQGALGIETRTRDQRTRAALAPLNDPLSHAAVLAERTLLADLAGGCLAPIAAWARPLDGASLVLDAAVLSQDGRQRLHDSQQGPLGEAAALGSQVAARLLARGAADLIAAARLPG
jgi:hydroxymethylbilane synthase